MNPVFNKSVIFREIFHRDFNIDNKHNIDQLPETPAVFGLFGIINNTPIHPRYISSSDNLRDAIYDLYENPPNEGMRNFMQTNWVQMLCYETVEALSKEQREIKEAAWIAEYKPGINADGEYSEYSYEWPYDESGNLKPEYVNPPEKNI